MRRRENSADFVFPTDAFHDDGAHDEAAYGNRRKIEGEGRQSRFLLHGPGVAKRIAGDKAPGERAPEEPGRNAARGVAGLSFQCEKNNPDENRGDSAPAD